jgi:hypothetical protein
MLLSDRNVHYWILQEQGNRGETLHVPIVLFKLKQSPWFAGFLFCGLLLFETK